MIKRKIDAMNTYVRGVTLSDLQRGPDFWVLFAGCHKIQMPPGAIAEFGDRGFFRWFDLTFAIASSFLTAPRPVNGA